MSSIHTYMYLKVFLKWKYCIALLMNSELVPSFAPDLEINQSFIHFLHQGLLGWFFYFDWTLRNIWYCISDNFTKVTLAYINYIHAFLPISKPELRTYFFTFTKASFANISLSSLKTTKFGAKIWYRWHMVWAPNLKHRPSKKYQI